MCVCDCVCVRARVCVCVCVCVCVICRDVELMTTNQSLGCDAVWAGTYIPVYQRKEADCSSFRLQDQAL